MPAIFSKTNAEGTLGSTSTAALAVHKATAMLWMVSKPAQMEARKPPTKQSPAPVRLLTDATGAGKCKA